MDGTMSAPERDQMLSWLKEDTPDNECRIITNVRVLSEGVDVPSLDSVLFLSARNSQVDVVQSVGRVMRRADKQGKKYGYIVIPVVVPADVEPEIALDDFGTGYSALSRMGELPVDVIKIDKSFIDKILVQDNQRQIIQELIAMCHKLGLIVVAEGVEHEEQRQYLLEAGCDLMQGYLYSKPVIEELALQKLRSAPLRTDERT